MPDIDQELQEITDLISLPEVYNKVRALMDDDHSDIEDFAAVADGCVCCWLGTMVSRTAAGCSHS